MKTEQKHQMVINEWFNNGFHAGKAYLTVYKGSKTSPQIASQYFNELLKKPTNNAYMRKKFKDARLIAQTSHESLLNELRNWVYSDITQTLTLSVEEIQELPPEIRRLIQSYEKNTYDTFNKNGSLRATKTVVKLKFIDKVKALDMINKHIGFYGEHNYQKRTIVISPKDKAYRLAELREKAMRSIGTTIPVHSIPFEEVKGLDPEDELF